MEPKEVVDSKSLRSDQYKNASNLNARIYIHRMFSTNPEGMHSWMVDRFDLPPNARILEVGCGPGDLWLDNLEKIPADWAFTMTDLSDGMVETARQNLGTGQFTYASASAEAIPFPDHSFDAVMAHFMIYHIPDREKGAREMRRVLKPGGKLYAATVGNEHMREIHELVNEFAPGQTSPNIHFSLGFKVETGAETLHKAFETVDQKIYPDSLEITEAEALVNYIASMTPYIKIDMDTQRDDLLAFIQKKMGREGVFRVTKSTGMFTAQ